MITAVLERTATSTTFAQSYVYAFDPTPEQVNLLRSHIGGTRFAYNALLGLVKANWDENRLRKVAGAEVSSKDYLGTGHLDLQRLWYERRDEIAPWWAENGSSTYNYACLNLSKAFTNWRRGRSRFPSFKRRGSSGSVSIMSGAVCLVDSHRVRVSRIGNLKTYESTRKLLRHLERGTGKVVAATITERRGKWSISFSAEVQRVVPATRPPEKVVGIDVGLSTLYTGATPEGEHVLRVANLHHTTTAEKRLSHAQRVTSRRQGPRKGVARPSVGDEPTPASRRSTRVSSMHARTSFTRRRRCWRRTTTSSSSRT